MSNIGRLVYDSANDCYHLDVDKDEVIRSGDFAGVVVLDDRGNPKWAVGEIVQGVNAWYMTGHQDIDLDGLWARTFDDDGEGVEYEYTIDPETGFQYEC